ncbi:MAG: diguanylate cyclase [Myxococcota bacterium]
MRSTPWRWLPHTPAPTDAHPTVQLIPVEDPQEALRRENAALRESVEALRAENEALRALSLTDALTGLPNHRAFRAALRQERQRALRTGLDLALVVFDLDDFKLLNDRHGHAVGDAVLARVAGLMRSALRETDLLTRYGGEEFALLAPGTDRAGALALAEKVRLTVAEAAFSVLGLEGPITVRTTVSAGVAHFRADERAFFDAADRALYRAKAAGKDCVFVAE